MSSITKEKLLIIAPGAYKAPNLDALVVAINAAAAKYGISNNPNRLRFWIANIAHESADFTKLEESLFYRDPVRIATIFKSGFDANKNKVADPDEIAAARAYVGQPEKLANRAYAGRFGNGDEASGDGWRYRGSGLIMTTFKDNYLQASLALFGDTRLVEKPELLRDSVTYQTPALSAGQYWQSRGCNELADAGQFSKCCVAVQGDASTVLLRKAYLDRATSLIL